jgi:hypothetical protein
MSVFRSAGYSDTHGWTLCFLPRISKPTHLDHSNGSEKGPQNLQLIFVLLLAVTMSPFMKTSVRPQFSSLVAPCQLVEMLS